jgi:hypothetical protein
MLSFPNAMHGEAGKPLNKPVYQSGTDSLINVNL